MLAQFETALAKPVAHGIVSAEILTYSTESFLTAASAAGEKHVQPG
jgi:hypothetical protein